MTAHKMNPLQIRQQGLEALVQSLGVVGMVRFMQQFDLGRGDYTRDRQRWLKDVTLADAIAQIKHEHT